MGKCKTYGQEVVDLSGFSEYEIEKWLPAFGSRPTEVVISVDRSQSYEMNKATVFKLKSNYALVTENGCSCYSSSDANIDLYPTKKAAMEAFDKWRKEG